MNWWKSIASMEIRKIFAYRLEFWVTFLGQVFIQYFIATALWENIFSTNKTDSLNGLNLTKISFIYFLIPIMTRALTGENIGFLSREIYEGTFSKYLIYPLSFFQFKFITYLTHSGFYLFQLSLGIFIYSLFEPNIHVGITNLLSAIFVLLLCSVLFLFMSFCLELIALWADNVWSLMLVLRFLTSFFGGGFIPLRFFPDHVQKVIAYTPFPYLIDFPLRIILGEANLLDSKKEIFLLLFWILFFGILMKYIWDKGQKNFTGVGI
jgi:ABC-2 type transport system permease protein